MTQIQINREMEEVAGKRLAVTGFCYYLTNRQDQAISRTGPPHSIPSAPSTARAKRASREGQSQNYRLEKQNCVQAINQGTHRPARGVASGLRIKAAVSREENDALTAVSTCRGEAGTGHPVLCRGLGWQDARRERIRPDTSGSLTKLPPENQ